MMTQHLLVYDMDNRRAISTDLLTAEIRTDYWSGPQYLALNGMKYKRVAAGLHVQTEPDEMWTVLLLGDVLVFEEADYDKLCEVFGNWLKEYKAGHKFPIKGLFDA